MAKKEIYKLDIEIGIKGDAKAQSTLKALDKYATLTEKRLKNINRVKVSPTAKLNDKLSSPLSRLERQTERLNRVTQSTVTLNDRASPSISRIDNNLEMLEDGAQANITAVNNASDVIDRIDGELDSIAQGNDVAITANDNASGTIAHVDGELESLPGSVETTITVNDQATETIRNIDMSLKDIENGMSSVGKKASVGLTAPILGVGTASAIASMDFETSMNKVSALSGATGNELASLEAKAREMGKTTQFSAKDSADALGYMALN
ncbi:MAG: phage tail tape measure protein [Paraclostridium sp.]